MSQFNVFLSLTNFSPKFDLDDPLLLSDRRLRCSAKRKKLV